MADESRQIGSDGDGAPARSSLSQRCRSPRISSGERDICATAFGDTRNSPRASTEHNAVQETELPGPFFDGEAETHGKEGFADQDQWPSPQLPLHGISSGKSNRGISPQLVPPPSRVDDEMDHIQDQLPNSQVSPSEEMDDHMHIRDNSEHETSGEDPKNKQSDDDRNGDGGSSKDWPHFERKENGRREEEVDGSKETGELRIQHDKYTGPNDDEERESRVEETHQGDSFGTQPIVAHPFDAKSEEYASGRGMKLDLSFQTGTKAHPSVCHGYNVDDGARDIGNGENSWRSDCEGSNDRENVSGEGPSQKRKRDQRQAHFQSMITDCFHAISGCFEDANRTIRDVESNQRIMLETENEFGEDLVNFGVRVREAADLMQKQIVAAFTSSYGKVEDLDSRAQHPTPGSAPDSAAAPRFKLVGGDNQGGDSTAVRRSGRRHTNVLSFQDAVNKDEVGSGQWPITTASARLMPSGGVGQAKRATRFEPQRKDLYSSPYFTRDTNDFDAGGKVEEEHAFPDRDDLQWDASSNVSQREGLSTAKHANEESGQRGHAGEEEASMNEEHYVIHDHPAGEHEEEVQDASRTRTEEPDDQGDHYAQEEPNSEEEAAWPRWSSGTASTMGVSSLKRPRWNSPRSVSSTFTGISRQNTTITSGQNNA